MNRPNNPVKIDTANRPAEADELNFEDDEPTPGFDEPVAKNDPTARNAGLTEASQPSHDPTNDDLTQEMLILEDGARSQHEQEQGNAEPTDKTLSIVHEKEIGGGSGLDEAELAHTDPLDKRKTFGKK